MTSKKAASAAADSQKKRKRDKVEDAGRSRKRKPQKGDEETNRAEKKTQSPGKKQMAVGGAKAADQLAHPTSRAIDDRPTTWRLSEPMGGSISDIDPIFSADEQHLILTYTTSVQVYSTADSLLERRIKLPETQDQGQPSRIVATVLSPQSPELLWIGCADGALFRADWTSGAVERVPRKQEPTTPLAGMIVELVQFGDGPREVLFLSEETAGGTWHVAAYDAAALAKTPGRTLFAPPQAAGEDGAATGPVDLLRTIDGGRFVVGARGKSLFVGGLKTTEAGEVPQGFRDLAYHVYTLDTPDEVACLDPRARGSRTGVISAAPLDLVVGCVRGAIYRYVDVFNQLRSAGTESAEIIRPKKHHWHRRSVYAVKWSRDGNYFISGGPETVLVLWQAETGKLDFLPHLSASIENIVVSPRGASYALHLDDNSAMVLSTAEMAPTCYVSGLQSLALTGQQPPRREAAGSMRHRAWQPVEAIRRPVPAVVDPADASRLWVRVGNGQKASMTGTGPATVHPSAALLQTFDLASFRSVAKQPLARTNPTETNVTKRGHPLTEPTVTHLCASRDGRWLASVDEWQPPTRDIGSAFGETASAQRADWARERREVHLKFWAVQRGGVLPAGDGGGTVDSAAASSALPSYDLVTRVDEAHFTTRAESVFGVAADPRHAHRFATLGGDGVVRFWGVRARVRDGLAATDPATGRPLVSWHCAQAVPLPLGAGAGPLGENRDVVAASSTANSNGGASASAASRRSGALAFSEDGSTVFAAFGAGASAGAGSEEAVLYTIDAESGAVRGALHGQFRGAVRGLAVLGASLILLSADLRVYDVVADELRYGLRLRETAGDEGAAAGATDNDRVASALTQLAVGRLSQTFVVAVPYEKEEADAAADNTTKPPSKKKQQQPPLASRLLVFSPDRARPLFSKDLPHLVVSLLPSVGLSGFLAIDAAAQVWSVADAADTAPLGQSLADLNLPTTTATDISDVEQQVNGVVAESDVEEDEDEADEEDQEMKDINGDLDDDDDDDEDMHDAVIASQQLRDIFEAAPATAAAAASIEELFWQVSGLLTGAPPKSSSTAVRAG